MTRTLAALVGLSMAVFIVSVGAGTTAIDIGVTQRVLEFAWKVSAGIGSASAVVLTWLVKRATDLELAKFKALLEARQKERDHGARLEADALQAQVDATLVQIKRESDASLERHKRELDREYDAKNQQRVALKGLSDSIAKVQATFRALTTAGIGLTREELDRRITAALSAQSELKTSMAEIKARFAILPDGFKRLVKNLDRALLGVIKQVREVPGQDQLDDGEIATLNHEYERIGKPAMNRYAAHLRTITSYLIVAIEYELNPELFVDIRVRQERNIHARALLHFRNRRRDPVHW